jgi:hypothetical protein
MPNAPGARRCSAPVQIADVRHWPVSRQRPAAVALVVPRASQPGDQRRHCQTIAPSTVRRWLREDAPKPWQYQLWIFIRDPDFVAKAERVLDLYAQQWDRKPLGDNDFVVSADEKTSIQARCGCHPSLPASKSLMMRVSHDYRRRGAPWPTSPPTTCTGRRCSPAARAAPASQRSPPRRTGHDPAARRRRRSGVQDRGQRLLLPRPEGHRLSDLAVIKQRLTRFESRYNLVGPCDDSTSTNKNQPRPPLTPRPPPKPRRTYESDH